MKLRLMQKSSTGLLLATLLVATPLAAQTNAPDVAQLAERISRLENQVQEISKLLEPLKAQQTLESRRKSLRSSFDKKMSQDRAKYSQEQLQDAESLYQVANQKWGTPEAQESLATMIKKYPDINRTGCAMLYVAQNSKGDDRARFLRDCIEKFGDCFYGDGVQVGAYARFLLAKDYAAQGEEKKSRDLLTELRESFPQSVDHSGNLLSGASVN